MNTLRQFRNSTGLSQDRMARRLGVSLSMYEKVERGNAKASRGFMEKIKEQFPEASIDEIFFSTSERDYVILNNEGDKHAFQTTISNFNETQKSSQEQDSYERRLKPSQSITS